MREIKYRAFCVATQRMFYVSNLGWDYHSANLDGVDGFTDKGDVCTWYDTDGTILHLMQFTGLLDKNNKDIYEGDVCTVYLKDGLTECMMIKWDDEGAGFRFYSQDGGFWRVSHTPVEVIGNIYENPELLNRKESK